MLYVHVDVAHGVVCGQVEHRLPAAVQIGGGGPGWQPGQVVHHHPSIDVDNDDPYRVPVEELGGFSFALFGMLLPGNSVVDVSGLRQRSVHRSPATGAGVRPAQVPGQPACLVIAYFVHERPQAVLGRVVAHADADQNGENDDKDDGTHDPPP